MLVNSTLPDTRLHGSDEYSGASTSTSSGARVIPQTQREDPVNQDVSQMNQVETVSDLFRLFASPSKEQIDRFVDLLKSGRQSDSSSSGGSTLTSRYFCNLHKCGKSLVGPYEFKVSSHEIRLPIYQHC